MRILAAALCAAALFACDGNEPCPTCSGTDANHTSFDTGPEDGTVQGDSNIDGVKPGKGTPENCDADKYFCYKAQLRHCTASGNDSVVTVDCADSNFPGVVSYTCQECPGVGHGVLCGADKPTMTGSATGIVSFSYSYKPGCKPKAGAYVSISSVVSHSAYPNGIGTTPAVSISGTLQNLPSGVAIPLVRPLGQLNAATVTLTKSASSSCSNYQTTTPPTTPGTLTVTYSGTKKGSTVTIKVDGKLSCNVGKTWEAFTYNATGIVL